jgi:YVTN family beta-propeller protein
VLDAVRHNAIETIKIPSEAGKTMPARPMGSVLAPDGKHIYVSDGRGESVAIIDVATRKVARMIDGVGARPWGIGVSSDGRNIYTANGPSDDVSVIDVGTGRVDRRIKVGSRPWGLVVATRP